MADELTVAELNRTRRLPALSDKRIKKFWQKVKISDPKECWQWANTPAGQYGTCHIGGRGYRATRVMWLVHTGIDPHGFLVLHRCDNPPCVNPDHLFLGDHKANAQDRQQKGRGFNDAFRPEWERRRRQTHCRYGHELSGANVVRQQGRRVCRECRRLRLRARRVKRRAKLSAEQVVEIRGLVAQGVPQQTIAKRFALHQSTVSQIGSRKRWKGIK